MGRERTARAASISFGNWMRGFGFLHCNSPHIRFGFHVDLVMLLSVSQCPSGDPVLARVWVWVGGVAPLRRAGTGVGGQWGAAVSAPPAGPGACAEPTGAATGVGPRRRWGRCLQGRENS